MIEDKAYVTCLNLTDAEKVKINIHLHHTLRSPNQLQPHPLRPAVLLSGNSHASVRI